MNAFHNWKVYPLKVEKNLLTWIIVRSSSVVGLWQASNNTSHDKRFSDIRFDLLHRLSHHPPVHRLTSTTERRFEFPSMCDNLPFFYYISPSKATPCLKQNKKIVSSPFFPPNDFHVCVYLHFEFNPEQSNYYAHEYLTTQRARRSRFRVVNTFLPAGECMWPRVSPWPPS